jgi:NTP pyrophosphatase (non-canonical NTP hydrolase)
MTLLEQLRKANIARCEQAFGHKIESWSPEQWTNALAGEVGELCNCVKKKYGRNELLDIRQLADEVGDILTYLDIFCTRVGISLPDATIDKFNEVSRKKNVNIHLFREDPNPVVDDTPEMVYVIKRKPYSNTLILMKATKAWCSRTSNQYWDSIEEASEVLVQRAIEREVAANLRTNMHAAHNNEKQQDAAEAIKRTLENISADGAAKSGVINVNIDTLQKIETVSVEDIQKMINKSIIGLLKGLVVNDNQVFDKRNDGLDIAEMVASNLKSSLLCYLEMAAYAEDSRPGYPRVDVEGEKVEWDLPHSKEILKRIRFEIASAFNYAAYLYAATNGKEDVAGLMAMVARELHKNKDFKMNTEQSKA